MSKKVTVLHYFSADLPPEPEIITLLGQPVEIDHINCDADLSKMMAAVRRLDGQVDAIALNGVAKTLRIGPRSADYATVAELFAITQETPLLDGTTLQAAIERWGVRLAHQAEPGIWAHKRVLMLPSLNHIGLAEALGHHATSVSTADHLVYFDPPATKEQDERTLLNELKNRPIAAIFPFGPDQAQTPAPLQKLSDWADILAGDAKTICKFAPADLQGKTVATPMISQEQVAHLRSRGVAVIITLLPNLSHDKHSPARHSAATLEACLTAVSDETAPLNENSLLNLIAEIKWRPSIQYLKPSDAAVNHFGFITQPNSIAEIRKSVVATRFLPAAFIHRTAVHIPPVFRGRMESIQADESRRSAVGEIMLLGGTPEEFTAQEIELVARRMLRAASMAERLDARIIGADTASREVSDAISAIAPKTHVPLTSGQAMTIYGALASGIKIATANSVRTGRNMQATVINASDPIVAVAAEVLASMLKSITLIGSEPDQLIALKRKIEDIHTTAQVTIGTNADDTLRQSDMIVIGRNVAGKRITFHPEICNPGAVICDFSQPTAISPSALAQRPDLTLIESAVFRLPEAPTGKSCGNLPHGLVSAPFAEAALLAIKGNFADHGLIGQLTSKTVYDIRDLSLKSNFALDGILAFGQMVSHAEIDQRGELAQRYAQRADEQEPNQKGEIILTEQADRPSIRRFAREHSTVVVTGFGVVAVLAGAIGWFFRKRNRGDELDG